MACSAQNPSRLGTVPALGRIRPIGKQPIGVDCRQSGFCRQMRACGRWSTLVEASASRHLWPFADLM